MASGQRWSQPPLCNHLSSLAKKKSNWWIQAKELCPCDGVGKDKATRGAVCIPPCTSRAHHLSPAQACSPARAICPTICPEKCWLEGQTDLPSCCCTRGFWINALALINQEYQDLSLNSLSSNRIRLLWFDADLDPYQLSGFLHLYFLDEAWWTKKPG